MATKLRAKPASTNRVDAVWIRKSGEQQEDAAQIANVKTMLRAKGITIPDDNWFVTTVSRRWVTQNEVFGRLMELIEADKIGTVYVEDQKRWGTRNSPELFKYIAEFRKHKCQLYDLRNNRDLAGKDVYSEIMAVIKSHESQAELKDLAFRPIRSKVQNFIAKGTWPTGTHPFGFGKRLFEADGKTVIWEFQPISRARGQLYFPDANGKLTAGPVNVPIPPKKKGMGYITKLVPSNNKAFVASVKTIFELFVHQGLSYRQIATQLNAAGRKFYAKPFNHSLVAQILVNPAYVGDTHYGKVQSGELCSFDASGKPVEMVDPDSDEVKPVIKRPVEERIVKPATHKGLIDRKTWNLAQKRITDMQDRPVTAPRSAEYYLKPILVCGHCGKNMTGSTDGKDDKQIVAYYCSTYRSGKSLNQKVKCGAHRITHAEAEKLLLDKLNELKLECDGFTNGVAHKNLQRSVSNAESNMQDAAEIEQRLVAEGAAALREFFRENYDASAKELKAFDQFASQVYDMYREKKLFTADFRKIVKEAEAAAVKSATAKLAKLNGQHKKLTSAFVFATPMMQATIKDDIAKVEAEIITWTERQKSVSERLKDARKTSHAFAESYSRLLDEWPAMELRERGEALRRIFKTVTLYWNKKFVQASGASRPLKTNRPGRYQYTLQTDKIGWEFATINVAGSS